jgi:hypothetical protein
MARGRSPIDISREFCGLRLTRAHLAGCAKRANPSNYAFPPGAPFGQEKTVPARRYLPPRF